MRKRWLAFGTAGGGRTKTGPDERASLLGGIGGGGPLKRGDSTNFFLVRVGEGLFVRSGSGGNGSVL